VDEAVASNSSDESTSGDAFAGRWPLWLPTADRHGYMHGPVRELARYTCAQDLQDVASAFLHPVANTPRLEPDQRMLTEALYQCLLGWHRPYDTEPFLPGHGQRIRDAEWIAVDAGTCIDFALVFASACLFHRLHPLILLSMTSSTSGHAVVACPVRSEVTPDRLGLSESTEADAVWFLSSEGTLDEHALRSDYLVIDPSKAARFSELPLPDNVTMTEEFLRRSPNIVGVDVFSALRSEGLAPFPRPPAEARPAIGRRLPPAPPWERIATRDAFVEELADSSGTIVLAGEQGVGKSRLAHRLASLRDDGCGWFLSGSDPSTLAASLAEAEQQASGEIGSSLTQLDRTTFARVALQRLRTARSGWAVVVDNAETPSSELKRWLPQPDQSLQQLVLVTTTAEHAPAWAEAGYTVVPVHPLSRSDVRTCLHDAPQDLDDLVEGRYLLVRAVRHFYTSFDHWPNTDSGGTGTSWFWGCLEEKLSESAKAAATAAAVIAPTPLPEDALAHAGFSAMDIRTLVDGGLIEQVQGSSDLAMHRLFATAVRSWAGGAALSDSLEALLGDPEVCRVLRRRTPAETLEFLRDHIRTDTRASNGDAGEVGLAYHGLAQIEELHGDTKDSAAHYALASVFLDSDRFPIAAADCLHGQARYANQHKSTDRDALLEAIAQAQGAEALYLQAIDQMHDASMDVPWQVDTGPARSRAMLGLLRHKEALLELDRRARLELLVAALSIIEEADRERDKILESGTDDLFDRRFEAARSRFNFGAPLISLAKDNSDDPSLAKMFLDRAERNYALVMEKRTSQKELGLWPGHPHVSACEHGLSIVAYYKGLLLHDRPIEDRVGWLRDATRYSSQALEHRSETDGSIDQDEATKSAALLMKITLARHAVAEKAAENDAQRRERNTVSLLRSATDELGDAGVAPGWVVREP
jgi:hypothetical protein